MEYKIPSDVERDANKAILNLLPCKWKDYTTENMCCLINGGMKKINNTYKRRRPWLNKLPTMIAKRPLFTCKIITYFSYLQVYV